MGPYEQDLCYGANVTLWCALNLRRIKALNQQRKGPNKLLQAAKKTHALHSSLFRPRRSCSDVQQPAEWAALRRPLSGWHMPC